MNFDPLSVDRRWDGVDKYRRVHYSLNTFAERERDTPLDAMHYYWAAKRASHGRIPPAEGFRPGSDCAIPLLAQCYGVDVGATDPANFIVRDHPGDVSKPLHGGLSNRRLIEFPSRIHAEASVAEYDLCRRVDEPLYHEIDQIVGGCARRYVRLMLPLADEAGQVVRIAYGIRHLEPVVRLF